MIITISRQIATNGEIIGRIVAEQLGMRYFDRELVDELARRLQVSPSTVERLDEISLNPVQSVLLEWQLNINEQTYARALRRALQQIQAEGNAVVVGRGANFILRCPTCFHVRIVASIALRIAIYRTMHNVSLHEAEQRVRQGDHDRTAFIRNLFHADINDPDQYDLVVNLTRIPPDISADIIVCMARERAVKPLPADAQATLPEHLEIIAHRRHQVPSPIVETGDQEVT